MAEMLRLQVSHEYSLSSACEQRLVVGFGLLELGDFAREIQGRRPALPGDENGIDLHPMRFAGAVDDP